MKALLALLLALPAYATTVSIERDGAAVQGEVCRFRAGDAVNPFKRWLESQEVTCVPSSAPVEFPRGLWNVFARSADGISTAVLVDGARAPQQLSLALRPAVQASAAEAKAVVYAPRLATAYPNPAVVPADEPLWSFVFENGKLAGPPAVVGWLQVPERDRIALEKASGVTAPGVRATIGAATRDADTLPPLELLHGAFFRIRDVAAGEGVLSVSGRGWIADRRPVKVTGSLTVVPEPLTVRGTATMVVNWSTRHDLVALERGIGACGREEKVPEVEVSLSSCPAPRPGEPAEGSGCSVIRTETFRPEPKLGSVSFDELVPGFYRAELRFGKLPPVSRSAPVAPLEVGRMYLTAEYFELYGSVNLGGQPLGEEAEIRFPQGIGFLEKEKDEYRGVIAHPLEPHARIEVTACDGEPRATVLVDRLMRRGTRFDIDIPDNELAITVIDTFTRETLPAAAVKMDVLAPNGRPLITRNLVADESTGRVTVKYVPPQRKLLLTVMHAGYQKQTVPWFSLEKSEKKELEVQLVPLRGSRGRIVSARPFDSAVAYWFTPYGEETERADVAPDGTFVYMGAHDQNETLAIVSLSHPLWVLRSPQTNHRDAITIAFPDAARARDFDVAIADADRAVTRYLGLAIGALRVPFPALRQHLQLRRLSPMIRGTGPARFSAILETAPIEILLGPPSDEVPGRVPDPFALPSYADAPRRRVGAEGSVVF